MTKFTYFEPLPVDCQKVTHDTSSRNLTLVNMPSSLYFIILVQFVALLNFVRGTTNAIESSNAQDSFLYLILDFYNIGPFWAGIIRQPL